MKKSKTAINGGRPDPMFYVDELDYVLNCIGAEQMIKLWNDCIPKELDEEMKSKISEGIIFKLKTK